MALKDLFVVFVKKAEIYLYYTAYYKRLGWFHDYNISDSNNKDLALCINCNWSLLSRKLTNSVNISEQIHSNTSNNYTNILQKSFKHYSFTRLHQQ